MYDRALDNGQMISTSFITENHTADIPGLPFVLSYYYAIISAPPCSSSPFCFVLDTKKPILPKRVDSCVNNDTR